MRRFLSRALFVLAAVAPALAARPAAADEPPPPQPAPPPEPVAIDVGPSFGFAYRIGTGPSLPIVGRVGGAGGIGLSAAPWSRVAVGLGWERSSVGTEHGSGDLADVQVSRSIDVIWASLKLYLVRADRVGLYAQIGAGAAIQHADADVLVYPQPATPPNAYACSETAGPGFALRAALGVEARIGGPVWLTAAGVIDHAQLSSDPLGQCAPGVGSLSMAGLRFGLLYRADVSRLFR